MTVFLCYFWQILEITDFFYNVEPFQYTSWINLYNLAQFFICTNFRGLFYFFILLFAVFLFSVSTMSLIIRKFKALSWFLRLKFRKSRFLKLRFPLLRYSCLFYTFWCKRTHYSATVLVGKYNYYLTCFDCIALNKAEGLLFALMGGWKRGGGHVYKSQVLVFLFNPLVPGVH